MFVVYSVSFTPSVLFDLANYAWWSHQALSVLAVISAVVEWMLSFQPGRKPLKLLLGCVRELCAMLMNYTPSICALFEGLFLQSTINIKFSHA